MRSLFGQSFGFLNPTLYQLGSSAIKDITNVGDVLEIMILEILLTRLTFSRGQDMIPPLDGVASTGLKCLLRSLTFCTHQA